MDVRLVVGGLLTRNVVLCELLWNYAERLERGSSRHGTDSAPCFIVPDWSDDQAPSAPLGSRVLTVEAHTARTDGSHHDTLDAILRLLHGVLTDDQASSSITARRLSTSADIVVSGPDTVARSGSWDIAPVGSCGPAAARRLLPWPDCSTSEFAPGAVPPATVSMN